MQVDKIIVGTYRANCYLVSDERFLVLVDPGADFHLLDREITQRPQQLAAIFLTHGHFDHHGAVDALYQKYQVPVYVGAADMTMLGDVHLNCGSQFQVTTTVPVVGVTKQTPSLVFGSLHFQIMSAPGHTNGSTLYLLNDQILFTGDVLFRGTIGRTDFPTGDWNKMQDTLADIRTFNPQWQVLPGHGNASTIAQELQENPYLCGDQS